MSTKTGKGKRIGLFFLPLAIAAPIVATATLGIVRFGPKIAKLLNILIKAVVKA